MKRDAFSQCHPLTNFLYFVGAIGFGVVIQHPAYLLAGLLSSGCYYLMLNGKKGWALAVGMLPLMLILSLLNPVFNTQGNTILLYVFGRPYTWEALVYGMVTALMFAVMILWFGCYSAVLTSDKFTCLFGRLIPALSLLLVMVLRMIPNLMRKARQISGARKSIGRGAGEQAAAKDKLTDGFNILSALTDWALEGSIVTADSMRARGYGAAKRTSFYLYRMTLRDWLLILLMAVCALFVILSGGYGAEYIPHVEVDTLNCGFVFYCVFLLIPHALQLKEAAQWHISISKI